MFNIGELKQITFLIDIFGWLTNVINNAKKSDKKKKKKIRLRNKKHYPSVTNEIPYGVQFILFINSIEL